MSTKNSHNQTLAQLAAHPTDNHTLVLRTPPGLASDMGRFEPARYDQAQRAYLIHADHLTALHRFAATIGLHIVDDRRSPPGQKTAMPECAHCGQPAALTRQPATCPLCGHTWQPVFVRSEPTTHRSTVRATCGSCKHTQPGRFPYCGACGAPIPRGHAGRLPTPRPHLDDPLPLGETVTDALGGADEPPF